MNFKGFPKESLIIFLTVSKPKTSVLVMHGNNELLGASSSSSKARTARQHHIPIVSSTYITRCLEECHILPPASFIQGNSTPAPRLNLKNVHFVSQVHWGKISLRPHCQHNRRGLPQLGHQVRYPSQHNQQRGPELKTVIWV